VDKSRGVNDGGNSHCGRMKSFLKTSAGLHNWRTLFPWVVTPVWVVALACFFYVLIRAGLPGQ
jgi:hypothetical protein